MTMAKALWWEEEEEILASDGDGVEEVLAQDNSGPEITTPDALQVWLRSGEPPVSPRQSMRHELVTELFDFVWQDLINMLLPYVSAQKDSGIPRLGPARASTRTPRNHRLRGQTRSELRSRNISPGLPQSAGLSRRSQGPRLEILNLKLATPEPFVPLPASSRRQGPPQHLRGGSTHIAELDSMADQRCDFESPSLSFKASTREFVFPPIIPNQRGGHSKLEISSFQQNASFSGTMPKPRSFVSRPKQPRRSPRNTGQLQWGGLNIELPPLQGHDV